MAMWPSSGQLSNSKCLVGCSLAFCFPGRVNGHHRQCLFFPSWRLPAVCRGGSWVTTGGKCRGITVILSWHRWIAKPPFRLPLTWAEQIAGSSCSSLGFCSLQPKAFLTARVLNYFLESLHSLYFLIAQNTHFPNLHPLLNTGSHLWVHPGWPLKLLHEVECPLLAIQTSSSVTQLPLSLVDTSTVLSVSFWWVRGNFQRARLAKLNWSENPCL